ncbi:HNH endonuclease [Planktothrix mougeotii LEGE 06226]|uniref:HNH endonuclease n=2 Tax=Planktothrix mougeotii TaxID=54306 RepID=A0ABR9UC18_9CYAN|nr:HNH endonuclease [Planktothrix mougeotii LEGE 06226]
MENTSYFEHKINSLLGYQNNVIKILVDIIQYCHNISPDKWAIYYKSDQYKIRLIVGNLIVLTIEEQGIWLALDHEILEENKEYQDYLEKTDTWTWDNHDYPSYSQVPSRNGYYNPSQNYDYIKDWNIIKNCHFSYIKKACAKYSKINQKSKLNHQPEIIKYLCNCLKTFVPQPDYYLNNSFFTFPEELSDETEIINLYEGAKQSITVNRYERNNQARKKCIEYYGTGCYVCGFNFEKIFGEIGQGFIHVHHLIPLSEINQEYEVDPIKDLRPVCPNCHAMIHRKNPPFSIEEIKNLLKHDKQCLD